MSTTQQDCETITVNYTPIGITYRSSSKEPDLPFWLDQRHTYRAQQELFFTLCQLVDSGRAIEADRDLQLPWDAVYDLPRSNDFADAIPILQIPRERRLTVALSHRGSLTDPGFSIFIEHWHDENGQHLAPWPKIIGAIAYINEAPFLLPEALWRMVCSIEQLAEKNSARDGSSDDNRRAWSVIRRFALETEAHLAHFLASTIVLTPERLKFGFRSTDIGGTKVVEVIPDFDGAPPEWVSVFDRFKAVPNRYDVSTGTGIVQVIVDRDVRLVLSEIKRFKGRRIAGARAEAFLMNPFAALGECASRVVDEDSFQQSRIDAGLTFQRFRPEFKLDANGNLQEAGLFIYDSIRQEVSSEYCRFSDMNELAQFIKILRLAQSQQRQLVAWRGYDLELLGDTDDHLHQLEQALCTWRNGPTTVHRNEVYDLTQYSSRIQGIGIERNVYSPYIARKDSNSEWIPKNVDLGIRYTPEGASEPIIVPIALDNIDALKANIVEAENLQHTQFAWPGLPNPIPLQDAKYFIETLSATKRDVADGMFEPTSVHEMERARRNTLLLKPNIESIDYAEVQQSPDGFHDPAVVPLPRSLRPSVSLKDHQISGVAWLQHRWKNSPTSFRGVVLADDMGLGKTIQVLTFISQCNEFTQGLDPSLIVAPVSLLENWKDEIDKFFEPGSMRVVTLYGDHIKKHRVPSDQIDAVLIGEGITQFLRRGWIGDAQIVLTTYETLRDLEFSLATQPWAIMVCDEAQKIKNPNALVTRSAKKQKARFRIACTGTPVENSLTDIWCLFDFVQPGLLGSLNQFGSQYRKPIEAETEAEKECIEKLQQVIDPQILRRLKSDVAKDLPKKKEFPVRLQMSTAQRVHYDNIIKLNSGTSSIATEKGHSKLLGMIHDLKRVCTDPRGMRTIGSGNQGKRVVLGDYKRDCPKYAWLSEKLQLIRQRAEKVIIFVEYRDIQRVVQGYVSEEFGFTPDIINGETSTRASVDHNRHKRIKAFQAQPGFSCIILSPLAVGFGVNIQAANHVIHYTRTWNPAKEDQATDRAYRIGQTKDVFVYYPMIVADDFITFDVKLDELLTWKRSLSRNMLNGFGDISWEAFAMLEAPDGKRLLEDTLLGEDDLVDMGPDKFECFCAALWQRQGYKTVYRTPRTGDGGVDVVAIGNDNQGVLIQCKSSTSDRSLGWEGVKDVAAGAAGYGKKHTSVNFRKAVATNRFFNGTARAQAECLNVELFDRTNLVELLKAFPVTQVEVEKWLIDTR